MADPRGGVRHGPDPTALVWLLIVALVGLAIWWLVRELRAPHRDRALELLRERYARGEISREEFERQRRDLEA